MCNWARVHLVSVIGVNFSTGNWLVAGVGFNPQARVLHDKYLRRARSGVAVCWCTHIRGIQRRAGHWWRTQSALVSEEVRTFNVSSSARII